MSERVRRSPLLACLFSCLFPMNLSAAGTHDPHDCEADGAFVNVEVIDLKNTNGNLTVTAYGDREEDFLAPGRKLLRKRVDITGSTTTVCLAVPKPGTYAIAVYHDEDDDHDFDRTLIGLPAEGYGFSNDAPALAGLPSFSDARFEVESSGRHLTIRMRY